MTAHEHIDHLVYGTPHLERTVENLAKRLGVTPQDGGRHAGFATRNAILSLGEAAYLEIIGPDPEGVAPENGRPFGIDTLDEPRFVTWAVAVTDLDATLTRARAADYDPGAVIAAERQRPDGEFVRFRIAIHDIVRPPGDGLIPFPIQWGDCEHPATGAPRVKLTTFRAEHPKPSRVQTGLAALGIPLNVMLGSVPALIATLEGPSGRVNLE